MIKKCALAMGLVAGLSISMAATAESPEQWYADGQATLKAALAMQPNTRRAKNVILFVGDGMGISTVTATRIFDGQSRGETGEENRLAWEQLPYAALSKTYNTNLQTPDSAGTMSAMMTGVKTDYGVISVNQHVQKGNCNSSKGNAVVTLLEQAEDAGLATGIVSTARITHATPAATYAHAASRDWESDADLPAAAKAQGCKDIASQLMDFSHGDGVDVVLGGGRRNFLPVQSVDPEHPDQTGVRTDGRDLIAQWLRTKGSAFVWSGEQLSDLVSQGKTSKILGLFSPSHMAFDADRMSEPHVEPSLGDMTEAAIGVLQQRAAGYFLMVEAGRIDLAHHAGNAARALAEGQALNEAVARALAMVDLNETLVIVTADHSHVFTIGGNHAVRGNPVLGFVYEPDADGRPRTEPTLAKDGRPYTVLGYNNGKGFAAGKGLAERWAQAPTAGRHVTVKTDTTQLNYYQESLVPLDYETHAAEDVAIYAGGPWAHLFHQTHEQNYIYHVMRHALGLDSQAVKKR